MLGRVDLLQPLALPAAVLGPRGAAGARTLALAVAFGEHRMPLGDRAEAADLAPQAVGIHGDRHGYPRMLLHGVPPREATTPSFARLLSGRPVPTVPSIRTTTREGRLAAPTRVSAIAE